MTPECTNEEIGRLIAYYELDQLSAKDRLRFEEHLMECGFCLQELQEMRPLVSVLRNEKAEVLKGLQEEGVSFAEQKQALQEAYRDRTVKTEPATLRAKLDRWIEDRLRPVIWIPAAAAAVVLLIWVLPLSRTQNPYLLYLDTAKAPYTQVTFRGPAGQPEEARQAFDAGMAEYRRDNYRLAIKHLQKAVRIAPEESQYWLYLGVCHYLTRRPIPAIEALTRALSARDETVKFQARWYLAQAYLLKGDAKSALLLLNEISRQDGEYNAQANSLLARIKGIK